MSASLKWMARTRVSPPSTPEIGRVAARRLRDRVDSCSILDAALRDKVDRDNGHGRLEYDGVAIRTGGRPAQAKFVVIVQYTRKTTDQKYDAGRGQKIGVINAFCRNQPNNKCPAWMNQ